MHLINNIDEAILFRFGYFKGCLPDYLSFFFCSTMNYILIWCREFEMEEHMCLWIQWNESICQSDCQITSGPILLWGRGLCLNLTRYSFPRMYTHPILYFLPFFFTFQFFLRHWNCLFATSCTLREIRSSVSVLRIISRRLHNEYWITCSMGCRSKVVVGLEIYFPSDKI